MHRECFDYTFRALYAHQDMVLSNKLGLCPHKKVWEGIELRWENWNCLGCRDCPLSKIKIIFNYVLNIFWHWTYTDFRQWKHTLLTDERLTLNAAQSHELKNSSPPPRVWVYMPGSPTSVDGFVVLFVFEALWCYAEFCGWIPDISCNCLTLTTRYW